MAGDTIESLACRVEENTNGTGIIRRGSCSPASLSTTRQSVLLCSCDAVTQLPLLCLVARDGAIIEHREGYLTAASEDDLI